MLTHGIKVPRLDRSTRRLEASVSSLNPKRFASNSIPKLDTRLGFRFSVQVWGGLCWLCWGQRRFSVFEVFEIAGPPLLPKSIGRFRLNEYFPCDVADSNCSILWGVARTMSVRRTAWGHPLRLPFLHLRSATMGYDLWSIRSCDSRFTSILIECDRVG